MGVGVQGEAGFSVAQNSGQSLGVHPAGQGMGCECVSEIMKAEAWQPRLLQQSFQVIVGGIGADGLFWPEGIRKGPLGAGVFLRRVSKPAVLGGRVMVRFSVPVLVSPVITRPPFWIWNVLWRERVPWASSKSLHMRPQSSHRRRPVVSSV